MIGSSHRRRAKSPLGTVLIINLLGKGLTPRACMGDGCSHRLIHDSGLVTNLMYVLKLFQVTAGNVHSFRIRSKETLRIMYPKYQVLDMIQRIHLHCGSFGSVIRFWILVKKRNICFRIKNTDLGFSKETHP